MHRPHARWGSLPSVRREDLKDYGQHKTRHREDTPDLQREICQSRRSCHTDRSIKEIAGEADCIYAVEQGEIEIPSFNNQRRIVCVLRFERIVSEPAAQRPHQEKLA
jgi:hypothetical protein